MCDGIKKKQESSIDGNDSVEQTGLAAKKPKLDDGTRTSLFGHDCIIVCLWSFSAAANTQADLERAEREIEQLKVDHEVALEKTERQV